VDLDLRIHTVCPFFLWVLRCIAPTPPRMGGQACKVLYQHSITIEGLPSALSDSEAHPTELMSNLQRASRQTTFSRAGRDTTHPNPDDDMEGE